MPRQTAVKSIYPILFPKDGFTEEECLRFNEMVHVVYGEDVAHNLQILTSEDPILRFHRGTSSRTSSRLLADRYHYRAHLMDMTKGQAVLTVKYTPNYEHAVQQARSATEHQLTMLMNELEAGGKFESLRVLYATIQQMYDQQQAN